MISWAAEPPPHRVAAFAAAASIWGAGPCWCRCLPRAEAVAPGTWLEHRPAEPCGGNSRQGQGSKEQHVLEKRVAHLAIWPSHLSAQGFAEPYACAGV